MAKKETVQTLSKSVEDYLKTLYVIEADDRPSTTGRIATRMGVRPASVTGMLQKLARYDPPLVEYKKHRGATLTGEGRKRALEVIRHHRLIELFLHEVLGYGWDEVHDEAEKLEHVISEEFENRIAERLGDPVVDPHGDPIPAKDGSMPVVTAIRLVDMEPGDAAVVTRITDGSPELFRFLAGAGIIPGAPLRLIEKGPFDGPWTVRVGESERDERLSLPVAARIHVTSSESRGERERRI